MTRVQDDDFMYYNASIVSEHVYKMAEKGLAGVLDALNLSVRVGNGPSTVQVSRLDVDQKYMLFENQDSIYVGMVGTKSLQDVLVDGQVQRRPVPFSSEEKGGVHAGFLNRSMDIPIHALYHQVCIIKGKRMVVCGHSLGGAVAALSTWRLISEMGAIDSVVCITFGSPGVYEHGGNTRDFEGVINFMAEDDPMSLLSRVSVYKHIGRVITLRKTGALSAEKHRMSYYRNKITQNFHGVEERDKIQGGNVIPHLDVRLVEGRFAFKSTTLYLDIFGDHLDFVRTIYMIAPSKKYLGIMKRQSEERIIAIFTLDGEVLSECHSLSVMLYSDFEISTYPVKTKRPVIWVIYTCVPPSKGIDRQALVSGAQVLEVVNDVDAKYGLGIVNICMGGTPDSMLKWIDRIRMAYVAKSKKAEYPSPDAILVMGKIEESVDAYHSLYRLCGTLKSNNVVLIYNTEKVLQEHAKYRITTLTGIDKRYITSLPSMEAAVQHIVFLLDSDKTHSKM